jgi:hypothetical protein
MGMRMEIGIGIGERKSRRVEGRGCSMVLRR